MKITLIGGARPNFMKIAPIIKAIEAAKASGEEISYKLVHTGQHYDKNMSGSFFEQLGIPDPHINLECGGGTHSEQTANIMVRFEKYLVENPADIVMVVGDVNSTMACSIVAKKLQKKVAHVEGGIRSGDWKMPEEINRIVTDSIADYFFTTSESANQNLLHSGIREEQIFFVGNTMIDTLWENLSRIEKPEIWNNYGLQPQEYIVMTLHRPSNVDEEDQLKSLLDEIIINSRGVPLIFPVHPRTAKVFEKIGVQSENLHLVEPMSYLEFIYLIKFSKAVLTDSGGITEETTVLGVPCMTLRNSTERPETVTIGTNELLGADPKSIQPAMEKLFAGQWKQGSIPKLWDGKTARRIVEILLDLKVNKIKRPGSGKIKHFYSEIS